MQDEYRGLTQGFVEWCQENHFLINTGKISVIEVGALPTLPVNIQGTDIERVDSGYLGVGILNISSCTFLLYQQDFFYVYLNLIIFLN